MKQSEEGEPGTYASDEPGKPLADDDWPDFDVPLQGQRRTPRRRRGYTVLWLIWLGMFGAIEGAALMDKRKGDTLTEHVRGWFSIGNKSKGWRLRRFSLLAFLAWLVAHFLTPDEF